MLIPYISNGPLISWMYPAFGVRGASWFLGVSEWLICTLLFLGFWNKRLGILGAAGSCVTFVATVTIIPFMPGWLGPVGRRFPGDGGQRAVPDEGRRAPRGVLLPAEAGRRACDVAAATSRECHDGGPNVSTGTLPNRHSGQRAGRQVAGLAPGADGTADGRGGTAMGGRLVPQRGLLAQQERDLERPGRPSGAPCRCVRRHERRDQDGHGEGPPAQARHGRSRGGLPSRRLQEERRRVDHGERAFRGAQDDRSPVERRRHAPPRRRSDRAERRNACGDAGNCRSR